MSAITNGFRTAPSESSGGQRIWNVARLHFTNKWQTIGVPSLAMGVIFLANLVIWWLVRTAQQPGDQTNSYYNGASFYLFVYMLVVAIQAMSRTFPFALGFSVTRRDYYLGTLLAFVIYSIGYGAALTLLSYIEELTQGWGVGLTVFQTVLFDSGSLWLRLFIYVAAFLIFFLIGMVCGTVYVRWRANGLITLGVTVTLLVIGSVALATVTKSWVRVGDWFVTAGAVGVTAWLLLFSILFGIVGYFILRRATPNN
jgi:hypothetical protein